MSQTNTACSHAPLAVGPMTPWRACRPIMHKRNSSELFVLTNFCSPCEASQHALANRTACAGAMEKTAAIVSTGGSCSRALKDFTTCGRLYNVSGRAVDRDEGSNQCSIVQRAYTIEGIHGLSFKIQRDQYLPVETTFDCSQNCVCEDINSNCPIPADVNTGGKSLEAATEECNGSNTCYGLVQLPTTGNSTYFLRPPLPCQARASERRGILPFTLLLQVPPDGVS